MRYVVLGAVLSLFMGSPAGAQTHAQLMAPIQKFMDSFNQGDMVAASATHAAEAGLVIIDEVPPYVWRGAEAFKAWGADLDADAKRNGITEPKVTIAAATRTETNGDNAYVIVPAVYTFKQGGVAMRETAQMTFVLRKGATGWLIHGWTWTGSKPQKGGATR